MPGSNEPRPGNTRLATCWRKEGKKKEGKNKPNFHFVLNQLHAWQGNGSSCAGAPGGCSSRSRHGMVPTRGVGEHRRPCQRLAERAGTRGPAPHFRRRGALGSAGSCSACRCRNRGSLRLPERREGFGLVQEAVAEPMGRGISASAALLQEGQKGWKTTRIGQLGALGTHGPAPPAEHYNAQPGPGGSHPPPRTPGHLMGSQNH